MLTGQWMKKRIWSVKIRVYAKIKINQNYCIRCLFAHYSSLILQFLIDKVKLIIFKYSLDLTTQ